MQPGQSTKVEVALSPTITTPSMEIELDKSSKGKFLIVFVDNLEQVTEKNETNNIRSKRIK